MDVSSQRDSKRILRDENKKTDFTGACTCGVLEGDERLLVLPDGLVRLDLSDAEKAHLLVHVRALKAQRVLAL